MIVALFISIVLLMFFCGVFIPLTKKNQQVAYIKNYGIDFQIASEIVFCIWKYKNKVPPWLLVFLAEKESSFRPSLVHYQGEIGLFGVSDIALLEVVRRYSDVAYNKQALFTIDYNTLVACKFLEICYKEGKDRKPSLYPDAPDWYKALMIYTDWLIWDSTTYKYATWIWSRYKGKSPV